MISRCTVWRGAHGRGGFRGHMGCVVLPGRAHGRLGAGVVPAGGHRWRRGRGLSRGHPGDWAGGQRRGVGQRGSHGRPGQQRLDWRRRDGVGRGGRAGLVGADRGHGLVWGRGVKSGPRSHRGFTLEGVVVLLRGHAVAHPWQVLETHGVLRRTVCVRLPCSRPIL